MKPGMVIAWICSGMVHHEFTTSLAATFLHDGRRDRRFHHGGFIGVKSSPRIVQSRTDVMHQFLTTEDLRKARWLITIDSDMEWAPTVIHDMLDRAEDDDWPIVGGLCIAGGITAKQYPTAYRVTGTHADDLPIIETIDLSEPELAEMVDAGTALKVDGTGAAFMAIRRDVALAIYEAFGDKGRNPYPWYGELIGPEGQSYGEDITLCMRARQLGYEIWLDTSAKIGHMKSSALTWDTYLNRQRSKRALSLP